MAYRGIRCKPVSRMARAGNLFWNPAAVSRIAYLQDASTLSTDVNLDAGSHKLMLHSAATQDNKYNVASTSEYSSKSLIGWAGLASARTYRELHPSEDVVIYEIESTLGGVWSQGRLYPGLKSNNMLGTYEYSDFPMDSETYGVKPGEHIPGTVIHKYLTNFAEKFGIFNKIQFDTKVETAEHQEQGGWLLTASRLSKDEGKFERGQIFASKLIVATGLTSEPSVVKFEGSESFEAPLFHSRDLRKYADTMTSYKSVCVLGGAKSAWDAVYEYATHGVRVEWVIRESGHGPTWSELTPNPVAPPYVTPLKKWLEKLVHTRLLTWNSPCTWGDADGYGGIRSLLHNSRIGRLVVSTFWSILGNDVITLNGYASHPETAKLKPWSNPFFIAASSLSILNYDTDFFKLVKGGLVNIHVADIESLSPNTVHLSDGQTLAADGLVACTGWKHTASLEFLPSDLNLGIPHKPVPTESTEMIQKADQEILTRFPRLRDQPVPNPKAKPLPIIQSTENLTPYNLYRFIVPPSTASTRDIAFAGCLMSISTAVIAQTQALWISAYFDNQITLPSDESDLLYETTLHTRFGKWRYPGSLGDRFPDFAFDTLPYIDWLLKDLELRRWRKGGAIREVLEPYGPDDYRGLLEEWKVLREGKAKTD